MSTSPDIAELIAEHARCWQAVGWSEASPLYDPGLQHRKQESLEATKALGDAVAALQHTIRTKEYEYQKLRAALVSLSTEAEGLEDAEWVRNRVGRALSVPRSASQP